MTKSFSKRMVVLRDIPSNIIEEAIFILKSDNEKSLQEDALAERKKEFFIVREAELLINSFNKENEIKKNSFTQKFINKEGYRNLIINTCMVGIIGILIALVFKVCL